MQEYLASACQLMSLWISLLDETERDPYNERDDVMEWRQA